MATLTRGLIIGKFYPLHIGHSHLINVARQDMDEVMVLVCQQKEQVIPVDTRIEWLQKIHPDIQVYTLDQDTFNKDDPMAWIKATLDVIPKLPTHIFSSETYGIQYAELLGCAHVMVDKERVTIPCSGSQIRQDPLHYLEYLHPLVADYYLSGLQNLEQTSLIKE